MVGRLLPLFALLLAPACSKPPTSPSIEVRDAWARATAPGQSSGAIYATIVNSGADDRLTGVSTGRAAMAMLHRSETANDVARMRMAGDVALPANGTVVLAPGGTHIMLEGLNTPLAVDEEVPVEFSFAKAGVRTVKVRVVVAGSR